MLRSKARRTIALVGATLVATSMFLGGCGRTATNPLAPDEPAAEEPIGEEPGEDPGWDDPMPLPGGGGVIVPKPGTGGVAPTKPTTGAKPAGGLRPLPKPTATPGYKAPSGGGGDAGADMGEFVDLLGKFGYDPGAREVQNVRMQVAVVNRVPAERFHFVDGPALRTTYETRAREWAEAIGAPNLITYEEWQGQAIGLAQRYQGISYYVGRRALYRDILRDRYNDTGNDAELVIYKRLNRTQMFVSYRADGQIDDFGFFAIDDWRNFLPVPGAFWN